MIQKQLLKDMIRIYLANFSKKPPVIIFSAGKVGSSSVYYTLKYSLKNHSIYHAHFLTRGGIQHAKHFFLKQKSSIPKHLYISEQLRKKIHKNYRTAQWKIITLVREPIAQKVSAVFQLSDRIHKDLFNNSDKEMLDKQLAYFKQRMKSFDENRNSILNWFERELKPTFGIDVFKYPFDKEKGYQIINYNNISLLIIRLESLNECFEQAMNEFFPQHEHIYLEKKNIAKNKWYHKQYAYVHNNLMLDKNTCEKYYSTKYMQHFYTTDMIQAFIEKWVE